MLPLKLKGPRIFNRRLAKVLCSGDGRNNWSICISGSTGQRRCLTNARGPRVHRRGISSRTIAGLGLVRKTHSMRRVCATGVGRRRLGSHRTQTGGVRQTRNFWRRLESTANRTRWCELLLVTRQSHDSQLCQLVSECLLLYLLLCQLVSECLDSSSHCLYVWNEQHNKYNKSSQSKLTHKKLQHQQIQHLKERWRKERIKKKKLKTNNKQSKPIHFGKFKSVKERIKSESIVLLNIQDTRNV